MMELQSVSLNLAGGQDEKATKQDVEVSLALVNKTEEGSAILVKG